MKDFDWIDSVSSYVSKGSVYMTPSGNTLYIDSIQGHEVYYHIWDIETQRTIHVHGATQWFNRCINDGTFSEKD